MGNKYEIIKELNQGSMGSVYLAQTKSTGKVVAMKTPIHAVSPNDLHARFQREIASLQKISHPNVVKILDTGKLDDGTPYFITPWLQGISLKQFFKQPIGGEKIVLSLAFQLLSGAAAAHDKGIVHRDLKPSNIVLITDNESNEYHLVIVDFGVSKMLDANQSALTITGVGVGTPKYMSPEQAVESKYADERADVYAIGLILYELFTGQHLVSLFPDYNPVIPQAFPPPTHFNSKLSLQIETVIQKSLSSSYDNRYANAYELLVDFSKAVYTPSLFEKETLAE